MESLKLYLIHLHLLRNKQWYEVMALKRTFSCGIPIYIGNLHHIHQSITTFKTTDYSPCAKLDNILIMVFTWVAYSYSCLHVTQHRLLNESCPVPTLCHWDICPHSKSSLCPYPTKNLISLSSVCHPYVHDKQVLDISAYFTHAHCSFV